MAERSKELIKVGYYLSKFGKEKPPLRLDTIKWNDTYRMFYDALHGGRAVLEFEHSLKNSRDGFDSYFNETDREGWKAKDGTPARLTGHSADVYREFEKKDEEAIWSIISKYMDPNYKVDRRIFNDLIAEDTANSDSNITITEGGLKVRISKTTERSAKLRQQALEIHGYDCQVCGFNFEELYGDWGRGFVEVHHIIPLAEFKKRKETDAKKDLAVLCANCHRMVHRKKETTLSLGELKAKLQK
ncbi:HNH endonuclease [Akkermansiaceae bacterium]|nr:HNH endonuclease [Akkermansiaceae bacterium]MDA7519827.1 HNH endonuclease [bacterium]MDA7518682.1 HNH endonuclease [Akkermansiaceae bacterium]MDA7611642.1 HNH endonuclease [bacterium]MDA7650946.1 HNH endonuclease [Akkermansiaceae bacterium]